MNCDIEKQLSDDPVTSAEAADKIRLFLANQIVRLSSRLTTEPDEMERKILQARIDNLIIAQKLLQARLMVPGHG